MPGRNPVHTVGWADADAQSGGRTETDSEIYRELALGPRSITQYKSPTEPTGASTSTVPDNVNYTVPNYGHSNLPPDARPTDQQQPGWQVELDPPPPGVMICYTYSAEGHRSSECPFNLSPPTKAT